MFLSNLFPFCFVGIHTFSMHEIQTISHWQLSFHNVFITGLQRKSIICVCKGSDERALINKQPNST